MRKALVFFVAVLIALVPQYAMSQDKSSTNVDPILKALGATIARTLYFSYISIGALADGFEKKVYTAQDIAKYMEANNSLIDNTVQILKDSIDEYEYSEEDVGYIESSIDALIQLENMANALVKYTKDKSKKSGDEFAKIKNNAWGEIKSLLGIE
jgi:hypothetical protein